MTETTTTPAWSSPLKTSDGRLLPTRGRTVCRWIERNCVLGEGDWFGRPVRLRKWQRALIHRLYEFDPDTGRRRFRRAVWGMAKGNGKTPLAACVAAYELFGGHHVSPRVIVGAASLKQANLVFGDLRASIEQSPTLSGLADCFELQILLRDRPGVAERIAAEVGTNDGARATAFIADELHEWIGRTSRVWTVVDGAVAKRSDAFSLGITTAGYDRGSLLWELYERGRDVAQGKVIDDSFLFCWWEAPEDCDLDSEEGLEAAMRAANPAYGDFCDPDNLRHRFATIPRQEFERYHLNRWTTVGVRWLPVEEWDACSGEPDIPEGSEVFVGIDGGAKRDSTAVVVVRLDEGRTAHVTAEVFEPPADGGVIDPSVVEEHIRDLGRRFHIVEAVFDPQLFFRSAQLLMEEGLPMVEFPQTHSRMCPASQGLYDAVMEHRIRHGGDPVLRAHADAAVAKPTGRGWRLDKDRASEHIDAMVALAMALSRAEDMADAAPTVSIIEW